VAAGAPVAITDGSLRMSVDPSPVTRRSRTAGFGVTTRWWSSEVVERERLVTTAEVDRGDVL
jgi:hypothetical protein